MAKRKIMLTGASGFLGRSLARSLSSSYSVHALHYRPFHADGISHYSTGNLRDVSFLERSLRGCSLLVHTAAITNTADPLLHEVNVAYTRRLVRAAKNAGIKTFVYISTENVSYHCQDAYTQSKQEAEHIILEHFADALILRPSLIFGKGDTRYLSLFYKVVRLFPFVPVFPRSVCTLQPIHVDDVCAFAMQGLRLKKSGIYTLVGSDPVSFSDLGMILAKYIHKKRFFIPVSYSLLRIFVLFLRCGPRSFRRLSFMIQNAFILRSLDKSVSEREFHYSLPPLEDRLRDLI